MRIAKLFILFITVSIVGNSQNISRERFLISDTATEIISAEFLINNISLEINGNGDISNFNYLFGGDFDYYKSYEGRGIEGKIKSIGNTAIDYYKSYDGVEKEGKIKSIGNIAIDYYKSYDGAEKEGKIKSMGSITIDYYKSYEGNERVGKIKSIGSIIIDYCKSYEGSERVGKIKSISGNTPSIYVITQ